MGLAAKDLILKNVRRSFVRCLDHSGDAFTVSLACSHI